MTSLPDLVVDAVPDMTTRAGICGLLAHTAGEELCGMVNAVLESGQVGDVSIIRPAVTGTIQLEVRDPVCDERFIVGDALVTTAEVTVDGVRGWAMRPGREPRHTVAAAIADAIMAGPSSIDVSALGRLLERTRTAMVSESESLRRDVVATSISFEELD